MTFLTKGLANGCIQEVARGTTVMHTHPISFEYTLPWARNTLISQGIAPMASLPQEEKLCLRH